MSAIPRIQTALKGLDDNQQKWCLLTLLTRCLGHVPDFSLERHLSIFEAQCREYSGTVKAGAPADISRVRISQEVTGSETCAAVPTREAYLQAANLALVGAKAEPAHSPTEDALIDCLDHILTALMEVPV